MEQPTLCSRCKKNVAVIFITKIENGESKNEGLCLRCARELHIKPIDDMIGKMGLSDEDLEALTNDMSSLMNGEGLAALQEELVGVEVTAPFSGTVVYITQAGIGDKIASFSPVASIVDNSRLTIISEPMSNSVLEGADQIYAEILGQRYDITHIPMEQEEYLQRLLAGDDLYNEFAVNNPSDALESGQYAAVTIIDNYRENVLVVPVNSLYRDEKGHYVYRVIDGARVRQDITVGITTDIEVEVLEGLEEGDVIYVKE